ncbi:MULTISPECIES: class F sortase [unclassified Streptomyces]|uniref:class F sortase n=1 Tax=unclassified Streptomyces TaxID=2593676 RepID=UPI0033F6D148
MTHPYASTARRPRRRTWSWGALAALALGGVWSWTAAGGDEPGSGNPPRPSAAQAKAFESGRAEAAAPAAASLPESAPVRVKIPVLDVDAPLTDLARTEEGGLEAPPPDDANLAGWDEAGTLPGSTGTAVIAGHVDTPEGPAVFYGLGALKKGAKVKVTREDGRTAEFTVDGVEEYEKDDFPSTKVYAPRARPELRLITCGGNYSKSDGYSGNIVVYAHLTGSSSRPSAPQ